MLGAIQQTRAQGLDAMPRQRKAFDMARDALDAIRREGSSDLNSAFRSSPELVREASEGVIRLACCRFGGHQDKVFIRLEDVNGAKEV